MPMLHETQNVLGADLARCDSRSLCLERFADPLLEKDPRRDFFKKAIAKRAEPTKRNAWVKFLLAGLGMRPGDLLFGKLQARLMINMAGGVMENAGICLDRLTSVPYIPGSAVKGCARRMAIQELFESGAGFQPAASPEILTAKSQRFDKCAEILAQIARVFGWGDLDWSSKIKDGRFISDFAYACGAENWEEIRERAVKLLFTVFPNWKPNPKKPLWESLPSFAGSVSFLPAYPVKAPNPDLELDVVTVHHKQYYAEPAEPQNVSHSHEKWQRWKREHDAWERVWGSAPDIEEPVPNVFPAVAPGHVFVFAVIPLRDCDATLLTQARAWLKAGLETFGLGAKTNAGYGWFDCSDAIQQPVRQELDHQLAEYRRKQAQAEAERKAKEEAEAKARAEQERLAAAPPPERFKAEYLKLADEPFATQAKKFNEMTDDQRHGFVLALKAKLDTAKRWARKKPELLKPWQDFAQKLQPPVQLP